MRRIPALITAAVALGLLFPACGRKREEGIATSAGSLAKLIPEVPDSLGRDPVKVARGFLEASLLKADYPKAISFVCRENRSLFLSDTNVQYIVFGRVNPAWSKLDRLKHRISREYMPVKARFNRLASVELASPEDSTRVAFQAQTPLFMKKVFETLLGPGSKQKFDSFLDSNVSEGEKERFYADALHQLSAVADTMECVMREVDDTLTLVKEDTGWRVCRKAANVAELFMYK